LPSRAQFVIWNVHGACVAIALWILEPHFFGLSAAPDDASFAQYLRKYIILRSADDLVRRDFMASGSSGNFRRLDGWITPDARIFASGLIGVTNGPRLGNFFWSIYYLFPRHIDASLDEPPRFMSAGWLDGADCDSREELFKRGYDIQLDFGVGKPEEQQMRFLPLTGQKALRMKLP